MPRIVDPSKRRHELAEAVWRVIRRDGLDQASVRNVAREAGLSMGSLRHYFDSQGELLAFAMRMVIERIQQRISTLDRQADPCRRAELVLAELLPMDAERQAENEVWLAFTARALVDPGLRTLRDEGYDMLRTGCVRLVEELLGPQAVRADVDREADRLHAFVDGLAVHAAMRPELNTPERMTALVSRHLEGIK